MFLFSFFTSNSIALSLENKISAISTFENLKFSLLLFLSVAWVPEMGVVSGFHCIELIYVCWTHSIDDFHICWVRVSNLDALCCSYCWIIKVCDSYDSTEGCPLMFSRVSVILFPVLSPHHLPVVTSLFC